LNGNGLKKKKRGPYGPEVVVSESLQMGGGGLGTPQRVSRVWSFNRQQRQTQEAKRGNAYGVGGAKRGYEVIGGGEKRIAGGSLGISLGDQGGTGKGKAGGPLVGGIQDQNLRRGGRSNWERLEAGDFTKYQSRGRNGNTGGLNKLRRGDLQINGVDFEAKSASMAGHTILDSGNEMGKQTKKRRKRARCKRGSLGRLMMLAVHFK